MRPGPPQEQRLAAHERVAEEGDDEDVPASRALGLRGVPELRDERDDQRQSPAEQRVQAVRREDRQGAGPHHRRSAHAPHQPDHRDRGGLGQTPSSVGQLTDGAFFVKIFPATWEINMFWRQLLGKPRKEVDTPGWRAIFCRIIRPYTCGLACLATKVPSLEKFTILNVKRVVICEREFEDYLGIFRLRDGRYVCVRGSYYEEDKTVSRVEAQASCFLDEIIRFGLTEKERRKLNLLVSDDPGA